MTRDQVLAEILAEREGQDRQWGGPHHDAEHSALDWVSFVVKHVWTAVHDVNRRDLDVPAYVARELVLMTEGDGLPITADTPPIFRRKMVVVAALALAAIEAYDRARLEASEK